MKVIKCGKWEEFNYCITKQQAGGIFKTTFFQIFIDLTDAVDIQKWIVKNKKEYDVNFLGITQGIVAIGMLGKPKRKFKNRKFASFLLNTHDFKEVMDYASKIFTRMYEFRIRAVCSGIDNKQ